MNTMDVQENKKIENMINEIRGLEVILDKEIKKIFNVETKRINEAVHRNKEKFPEIIDLDRLLISGGKNNYYVHKDIVFTQFLDINGFLYDLSLLDSYLDYEMLINCQNEIENYFVYRNLLELNYNLLISK